MNRRPPLWCWVFAACLIAIGVADAIVLDLTKGYFGTGYNGVALHGAGERTAFFALGALLDAALLAGVWCAVIAVARVARAHSFRSIAVAAVVGLAIPLTADLAIHRLHRVLGDILDLRVLLNLAAGSWLDAMGEAAQDLPPVALLSAFAAGGVAVVASLVTRAEARFAVLRDASAPRPLGLAGSFALIFVLGGGALAWSGRGAPQLEFGLAQKPSGRAVAALIDFASDIDRDGYGVLARPRDAAPLDPRVHPYAVDVPGNGIDENGWAGDLPVGLRPQQPVRVPDPRPRPGAPSVVLIFLESFRDDLIGARVNGRPVTPHLDQLATEGARGAAYAHSPVTWASRASLMQGRVVPTETGTTLVDDFVARGYDVAWFSGQHDGVASDAAQLGTERTSHFYDARADVERRTSRSAQPISLQVSAKTVVARVSAYLDARSSRAPLFLYVNLVDTHFPYWHSELDDRLGVGTLSRGEIRRENRELVWRAYANAAANVDAAIAAILGHSRRVLGDDLLIVVTADHGQAFYETRVLGHGQALDDVQTRVPLIVRGLAGPLPGQLALSDLRGAIGSWLDRSPVERRNDEILQWVGEFDRARKIGLRTLGGASVVDFADAPNSPGALQVIRAWETELLARPRN